MSFNFVIKNDLMDVDMVFDWKTSKSFIANFLVDPQKKSRFFLSRLHLSSFLIFGDEVDFCHLLLQIHFCLGL